MFLIVWNGLYSIIRKKFDMIWNVGLMLISWIVVCIMLVVVCMVFVIELFVLLSCIIRFVW